jgi:hypothetical protein
MAMRSRLLFKLILVLAPALVACDSGDPVVARVGEVDIALSEVEHFVAKLPQALREPDSVRAVTVDQVQSVIDHHLLLQEARRRGLDTLSTLRNELAAKERSRLSGLYRQRSGIEQVDLSREEVEQAHIRWGMDRQRYFTRLVVVDEERLRAALDQIKSDVPLATVRELYGVDDAIATEDGSVGWIGVEDLARYFIPAEVFFSVENGRFAPVVDLGGAWQIYRFEDTRTRPLSDTWDRVHARLLKERTTRQSRAAFEQLAHELDLRINGEGLKAGIDLTVDGIASSCLIDPAAKRPLYQFDNGGVAVGDFLAELLRHGYRGALRDSAHVKQLAEPDVLMPYLFAAQARNERWDEEAEFRKFADKKERGLLLQALEEQALQAESPVVAEAEIRRYYERFKDRFKVAESVVIQRLYVESEEEAQALKREIDLGAAVSELLDRPSVAHYVDPRFRGVRRLFRIHAARFPELVEVAFAATAGEVVGPVALVEGFAVFEVLEKKASELRPYAETRREIRRMLIESRKEQAMIALIRRLRDEYGSQVTLYEIPALESAMGEQ